MAASASMEAAEIRCKAQIGAGTWANAFAARNISRDHLRGRPAEDVPDASGLWSLDGDPGCRD